MMHRLWARLTDLFAVGGWLILLWGPVFLLLTGCAALTAQAPPKLAFQAVALVRPISEYRFWSHRLDLGFRYRPCVGRVCGQVGALLVGENPVLIGDAGTVLQHFGAAADIGMGKGWRVGASVGQFLLTMPNRPFDYYRFIALSVEHLGPFYFKAESQVYQFDMSAEGPVIHQARIFAGYEVVTLDLGYVMGGPPQRYGFLVGTMRMTHPSGFFGQVGWQPMPALDGRFRHVGNSHLALGWRWAK